MAFDATAWLPALVLFMLFAYWIHDGKLFSKLGFTSKEVIAIFAIKCGWCLLNAWLHWAFQNGGDTYDFFQIGAQVHRALFRDAKDFFALVFLPNEWFVTEGLHHYYRSVATYGNEDSFLLVRLNALFYLVSFGSYPAHLILFSFVTLPGVLLLLRFAYDHVKFDKRWINRLVVLFPGVALWCNGMHKEALAFSGLGYLLYTLASIRHQSVSITAIGLVVIGLVHFVARWYLPILLLPVFFSVYLYRQRFTRKLVGAMSAAAILTVATLLYVGFQFGVTNRVVHKLHAFNQLSLDESFKVNSVADIVRLIPQGLYNGFVAPLPFNAGFNAQSAVYFLLNMVALLIPFVLFRQLNPYRFVKFGIWFIGVALIGITVLGIVVPHAGAIQRYKAPLVVIWLLGWLLSVSVKRFKTVEM